MNDNRRVQSYRDLIVWQKSIELVKNVYCLIRNFPKFETYGLSDQLRRSSVSVPSNIAEGQARQHTGEFRQFLYISLGSIAEVDTQIIIAEQLNYISDLEAKDIQKLIIEIQKMLRKLIVRLPNH
ncbi:MAG: four helix bundle protein [Chloroflexi bacterium]|nr:MAG: four helix bundle protein [Chloroflexota bacterium]